MSFSFWTEVQLLLITHYSLLITHYSLLTTHYSLLITHYSLLITRGQCYPNLTQGSSKSHRCW
ncbi:MAG: hypothetical protein F6K47_20970 [Symploca sp. SIO2E6]|nr:hypothetical protein [Symploca sp. SIO2E6]